VRIASLVKISTSFGLPRTEDPIRGSQVQIASFIAEKCLNDTGFKIDALSESQIVLALIVIIAIGDPISQFVPSSQDGEFEKLTFAAGPPDF
jgi:hypothetical protein